MQYAVVLVAAVLVSILARQAREIGVMKAIGSAASVVRIITGEA